MYIFILQAFSESSKKEIEDQQSENPNDLDMAGNQGPSNLNKSRNCDSDDKQTREGLTGTSEDESSYSSFYSSFLKTDSGRCSDKNGNKDDVSFLLLILI